MITHFYFLKESIFKIQKYVVSRSDVMKRYRQTICKFLYLYKIRYTNTSAVI